MHSEERPEDYDDEIEQIIPTYDEKSDKIIDYTGNYEDYIATQELD